MGRSVSSKEVIEALLRDGWVEGEQEGSHRNFKKAGVAMKMTIQHPRKDIPIGTLKSYERKSGLKLR